MDTTTFFQQFRQKLYSSLPKRADATLDFINFLLQDFIFQVRMNERILDQVDFPVERLLQVQLERDQVQQT